MKKNNTPYIRTKRAADKKVKKFMLTNTIATRLNESYFILVIIEFMSHAAINKNEICGMNIDPR